MKKILATALVAIITLLSAPAEATPRDPAWSSLRPGQTKAHVQAVLGDKGWRISKVGDELVKGYSVQCSVVVVTYVHRELMSYSVGRP